MARLRRRKAHSVREVLLRLGMSEEEISDAEAAGTDELLAIDGLVLPERLRYTLDELADKVGTPPEVIRTVWRALGFADPGEGERAFTKRDVSMLEDFDDVAERGLVDPQVALQLARVIGVSVAQIASAVVDASEARAGDRRDLPPGEVDDHLWNQSLALRAGELFPLLSDVVDYALRRHVRAATRRRLHVVRAADDAVAVGFADLVNYTELSAQLDERQLAELVGRFDELTNATVVRHGGRIVKMIGDAAMFTVVEPAEGAVIALELAEAVAADDLLSGIRVGLASGPVLSRDGDLYGSVVNMASRLVSIGRAGAINVGPVVRRALAGDDRFALRSLGVRRLHHIGDVRVYRLRPGPRWATVSAGGG
jgi:adenylate cyclase